MGKVLAHAFALRQRLQRRGIHLGAQALVGEVAVNAVHQVQRTQQQALAWRKAGACVAGKVVVVRRHAGGKNKFVGRIKLCACVIAKALAHHLPGHQVVRQVAGLGVDLAGGHHAQAPVRHLQ